MSHDKTVARLELSELIKGLEDSAAYPFRVDTVEVRHRQRPCFQSS